MESGLTTHQLSKELDQQRGVTSIGHQAATKHALLVIAPDLGSDGVGLCHRYRVTPTPQAVDKGILPINPHLHLQAAVVVSE